MDPTEPSATPRIDWREQWRELRQDAGSPRPLPPPGRLALVRYGLAQPFLGLRIIVRTHDLLGIALAPACGVLIFAGVIGFSEGVDHGVGRGLLSFLLAIIALAPVPSLLFGRIYAHLAAKARGHLGLPPHEPYIRGVVQLLGEWVAQLLVLALGVSLYAGLVRWLLGPVGVGLAIALQGAWALHWIVVEGYDNSRTLPPGRTVAELEALGRERPGEPWFHRWHDERVPDGWLRVLLSPFRIVSSITAHFAGAWRQEVDLVEQRPWISLGFGLGVAAMLAVPGLNLLFRPAVVVAGVHLRHRLLGERPELRAKAGGTAPYAVIEPR